MQNSTSPWVVIKFGGTSVSTAERWETVVSVIQTHLKQQRNIIVVCSAPAHVSNNLLQIIEQSLAGQHKTLLAETKTIYQHLAQTLQVEFSTILQKDFNALTQLLEGVSLIQEASPRIRAKIMAFGELMLTKLGFAYCQKQGIHLTWQDAREILTAETEQNTNDINRYLACRCDENFNPKVLEKIESYQTPVILTQGFIAHNDKKETVLLGRGGSDSSAAYIAATIKAATCEIWTDVSGIYTANPHQIPEARLIKKLDYYEAQEIASMGAKVLHPNCIGPLRRANIPLYIRNTLSPSTAGSVISFAGDEKGVAIKSIITKHNILLISIETIRMWNQVGFLSKISDCFKSHGFSIDLISTSESNITVSLDSTHHQNNQHLLDELLADLNSFARASIIGPCASISLVGKNIRMIMHELGSVFEVFKSQPVYLLSQAANNLNLTFVIDADQAEKMTKKIHTQLIEQNPLSYYLGNSWQEDHGEKIGPPTPWWQKKSEELLALASKNSPLYVYDIDTVKNAIQELKQLKNIETVFYAMKANSNETILKTVYEAGLGIECVSLNEIQFVLKLFPNIEKNRILFTPNFAPKAEYAEAFTLGVIVNVDNLYPLTHWPDIFKTQSILVRLDPGYGAGHHKHVVTGGSESKFGIPVTELDTLLAVTQKHQVTVKGLHVHSGSGILQSGAWQNTAAFLTGLLPNFPDATIINLGGGLGVVEKPGQKPLDLNAVNESLQKIKLAYPQLTFWLEPGRFIAARAGVILAKVTQIKQKGAAIFIGIDAGMNSLIRPALYGAYHEIVNLSRLNAPKVQIANIVGPICESGDTLGYSRLMPETQEDDILLIANTGAYGYCMSSHYNLRAPAKETMIGV